MKFIDLNLPKYILDGVKNLGFVDATEIQEKCIPLVMEGKDVIGKSQTGSGKTFAYGIPAIEKVDVEENFVQVLVVCPTRELAMQVCDELKKLTVLKEGCKVVPIYGGSNMDRQKVALKKGARIVVGTPGRIMDHLRRKTMKLENVKMVILDEADEMLNMGFKEDIETILQKTNTTHQTVMFSATMPKAILNLTKEFMNSPTLVEISHNNETSKLIKQQFVDANKKDALLKIYEEINPKLSIVFCNTKAMVDDATEFLNKNGLVALALHGDMRQNARKKALADLKDAKANILVATDVAARGLDIKDVDLIVNYDLPYDVEYYIHRIGRTGRAGKGGEAISLITSRKQREQIMLIQEETKANITELFFEGLKNNIKTDKKAKNDYKKDFSTKPFKRTNDKKNDFRKNDFRKNDEKTDYNPEFPKRNTLKLNGQKNNFKRNNEKTDFIKQSNKQKPFKMKESFEKRKNFKDKRAYNEKENFSERKNFKENKNFKEQKFSKINDEKQQERFGKKFNERKSYKDKSNFKTNTSKSGVKEKNNESFKKNPFEKFIKKTNKFKKSFNSKESFNKRISKPSK